MKMPRGFTLVEIIIYTGLLSILMASIMFVTQAAFHARAKTQVTIILEQNLRFAMQDMVRRIETADTVTQPTLGDSQNTLQITSEAVETFITQSDGQITVANGIGTPLHLTSPEIVITNLSFTRLDSTPAGIRIEITGQLPSAPGPFQSILTLTDTAVVRK